MIKVAFIAIPLLIMNSCVSNSGKSKDAKQSKQELVGGITPHNLVVTRTYHIQHYNYKIRFSYR